jgi:hypothetical protein
MSTVVNLTGQVLLVRLNSGQEVNLAPGQAYPVVAPEIRRNPVVEKLVARGLVKISEEDPTGEGGDQPRVVVEARTEKPRSRTHRGGRP